ncbi:phosphotransferase family protein [Gorillibacterium sp. sgz500922]|uniref:phosphotransferase family protein n=1 Tax=Gorillibacterium sp. sgz500922 TaxID=3446694 RepID=UPI003F665859
MESAAKSKLNREQLDRIVLDNLNGKIAECRELTDGWANSAYRLKLEDGREAILKAAPSNRQGLMRCERDNMRAEVEAIRLVREHGIVLPTPEIYAYDPSRSKVPCEYFLMQRLEGEPYNKVKEGLSQNERDAIERELGVLNRRLHELKGRRFGYFCLDNGSADTWTDAFRLLMEDLLLDGEEAGVELPVRYADIRREVEARIGACSEVKEPTLVHWDLWDGNVFVQDGRITGIIDFERALWADPLMEAYFGKWQEASAYRQGYGKERLTEEEAIRRQLYILYLDLIMVIECKYRQYTNRDHVAWTLSNLKEGLTGLLK